MFRTSFSGIEVWRADLPLRLTFSHSLATRERVDTLVVAVRTRSGTVGYGQALPRAYLTGESLHSVLADIQDLFWPALLGVDFSAASDFDGAVDAMRGLYEKADDLRKDAAYAALECAALDAVARELGVSAIPRGGDSKKRTPLVGVVPACSPRKAAWLARIMCWLGYRRFKVKVGADASVDAERLAAVRGAVGGSAWLAVDANQAWEPGEAVRRIDELRRFGVELVEEPLRREHVAFMDFRRLEMVCGVGIMADESMCTLADARRFVECGGPSWWNLRIGKNGGFAGVRELSRLAIRNGVRVYGGVLVGETSVLAAAGRNALLAAGAECLEYGFPRLFLKGDPFRGGPGGFDGWAKANRHPVQGIGVRLLCKQLAKVGSLLWAADIDKGQTDRFTL